MEQVTTVVRPGDRVAVEPSGNLVIAVGGVERQASQVTTRYRVVP
jgi:hypothetical protein